ncbi:hypothetical protein P7K49_005253 [Saguinus oedipus]|uniref:CTNNB1 binding N-teminal domain-containing protein n=1 Tax=Saguinus oedipus TaxID=9490 RepID=A0ABQ9W9T1_SAGOE|nr:hypothetical protein P7K49_005253 [Saguinus oedipus]
MRNLRRNPAAHDRLRSFLLMVLAVCSRLGARREVPTLPFPWGSADFSLAPFKTMPEGASRPLPGEEGRSGPAGGAFDPAPPALRPPRSGLGGSDSGLAAPRAGSAPRTPGAPRPGGRAERTMPQLDSGGGGSGGGDDLGAPDELLAFQDEGEEQDDKSRDSAAGPERDLAELKSSLVNESEGAAGGTGIPGVPGTGAGTRGEAEVSARRLQLLPRGHRAPPPPLRAAPGVSSLQGTPSWALAPIPAVPAPLTPLRFSLQALGREHAAQRLFPDKLPEPLEDGEFLPCPAPLPRAQALASVGPGSRGPWGAGCLPHCSSGGGRTRGWGVGGGLPGRRRVESLPVP